MKQGHNKTNPEKFPYNQVNPELCFFIDALTSTKPLQMSKHALRLTERLTGPTTAAAAAAL